MNNYMNLDDLVCEGYDIILEASTEYNNLCIAMMKLEHKAIMNEDSNLLNEGTDSFGSKVKGVIKRTWERFKAFLDKVIIAMQTTLTKLSKKQLVRKIKKLINNETYKNQEDHITIPQKYIRILLFIKKNKISTYIDELIKKIR